MQLCRPAQVFGCMQKFIKHMESKIILAILEHVLSSNISGSFLLKFNISQQTDKRQEMCRISPFTCYFENCYFK